MLSHLTILSFYMLFLLLLAPFFLSLLSWLSLPSTNAICESLSSSDPKSGLFFFHSHLPQFTQLLAFISLYYKCFLSITSIPSSLSFLIFESFPLYPSELLWFLQRWKKLFQAAGSDSLRPPWVSVTSSLGRDQPCVSDRSLPSHPSQQLEASTPSYGHETGFRRDRSAGRGCQLLFPPSGTNTEWKGRQSPRPTSDRGSSVILSRNHHQACFYFL